MRILSSLVLGADSSLSLDLNKCEMFIFFFARSTGSVPLSLFTCLEGVFEQTSPHYSKQASDKPGPFTAWREACAGCGGGIKGGLLSRENIRKREREELTVGQKSMNRIEPNQIRVRRRRR